MPNIDGAVAVVTGAGSGIGAATATLLAARGAAVGVVDIDGAAAEGVAARIHDAGGRARPVALDVADEAGWISAVAAIESDFGAITLLHANAALTSPADRGVGVNAAEQALELWDRVFDVNVSGCLLAAKHTIPSMIAAGGGAIVLTASVLALVGRPDLLMYSASKGAVVSMTRSIAAGYGRDGIRCNCVAPGVIDTEAAVISEDTVRMISDKCMIPRLGVATDIANTVAFLLSEESAYITGQIISVDGGMTASYQAAPPRQE